VDISAPKFELEDELALVYGVHNSKARGDRRMRESNEEL
jgi:hypothetical protein